MSLDLYAGPLFRYYMGDWENLAQRYARENGLKYVAVHPEGETGDDEGRLEAGDIRASVETWREVMTEGLGSNIAEPLLWNESPDAPYFTDRPHWDGYAGLMLLAAHEEHPEIDPPVSVSPEWHDDPAFAKSAANDYSTTEYIQILSGELWVPTKFEFTFKFLDLTGRQIHVGSAVALLEQLQTLNDRTYKGQPWDLKAWRDELPTENGSFEVAARFGLSVFTDLARRAIDNKVPLRLDY